MSWKGSYHEGQTQNQLNFTELNVDEQSGHIIG